MEAQGIGKGGSLQLVGKQLDDAVVVSWNDLPVLPGGQLSAAIEEGVGEATVPGTSKMKIKQLSSDPWIGAVASESCACDTAPSTLNPGDCGCGAGAKAKAAGAVRGELAWRDASIDAVRAIRWDPSATLDGLPFGDGTQMWVRPDLFYSYLFKMEDLCAASDAGPGAIATSELNDSELIADALSTTGLPHEPVVVEPFDEANAVLVNYHRYRQDPPQHLIVRGVPVAHITLEDVLESLSYARDAMLSDYTDALGEAFDWLEEALDGRYPFVGAVIEIPWREAPYEVSGTPELVLHPDGGLVNVTEIIKRDHWILRGVDPAGQGRRPRIKMKGMPHTSATGGRLLRLARCSHFRIEDLIFDGNRAGRGDAIAEGFIPDALDPDLNEVVPNWGGGNNLVLASCSDFHFLRVSSVNSPSTAISVGMVREVGHKVPRNLIFEDSEATCHANAGLAIMTGHRVRVLGGQYSFANGFWTQAGIQLEGLTLKDVVDADGEPVEGAEAEAMIIASGKWPAVGICDVLIKDVRLIGNWKGVQINNRFGTRGITIRDCTFVGRPLFPRPACPALTCAQSETMCDVPMDHIAQRSWAIAIDGAWVAVVANKFARYSEEERVMDSVVMVWRHARGRVAVGANRFEDIDTTPARGTRGDKVKLIPINIYAPEPWGTESDATAVSEVTVRNNIIEDPDVGKCFINAEPPNRLPYVVEQRDNKMMPWNVLTPLTTFCRKTFI